MWKIGKATFDIQFKITYRNIQICYFHIDVENLNATRFKSLCTCLKCTPRELINPADIDLVFNKGMWYHSNIQEYTYMTMKVIFIAMNHINHNTRDIQARLIDGKKNRHFICIYISSYDKRNKDIMYNPSLTIQFLYSWQKGQTAWTYGPQYLLSWSRTIGGYRKNE